MIFFDSPLQLDEMRLSDALGVVELADLPNPQPDHKLRLQDAPPILERLWRIALCDVEKNIVRTPGGIYFGAGSSFGTKVFTRDIAYSGVLALNRLYPDILRSSLDFTLRLRLELGFKAPIPYIVPEIDAPWEEYPGDENSFVRECGTNNFMRRTDDVVRLWALGELAAADGSEESWREFYNTGELCFQRLYAPMFDPAAGLYRGQASFIDVHFDSDTYHANGYPQDWHIADCLLLKATSTNALYFHAMRLLQVAANKLGDGVGEIRWGAQATALAQAMRERLRRADGTFEMYLDREGQPAGRLEALGTGLVTLLGVVEGEEARAAIQPYPVTDAGVPIFHPFYPEETCYHNLASWPFVDTFFLMGRECATGRYETGRILALTARVCRDAKGFRELVDIRTKQPKGSGAQLWTAAAFLGACLRAGYRVG